MSPEQILYDKARVDNLLLRVDLMQADLDTAEQAIATQFELIQGLQLNLLNAVLMIQKLEKRIVGLE